MTRLSRRSWPAAGEARPVRALHLGLGAFHRSHQAWYTEHAADPEPWGIAAFTGRGPGAATLLAAQDGLYTLIERGPDRDRPEVVASITAACDGDDAEAWAGYFASPRMALVTLTVTEAGYHLDAAGHLELNHPEVAADVRLLRGAAARRDAGHATQARPAPHPRTMPGRLVAGLAARRRAGGGPIAIVPCDNLMANGAATRAAILELCRAVDDGLAGWISANVSFVSTVVDRITPATTVQDLATARRATAREDRCAVVTEPYSEWVLAGDFPAGRPAWESAGARFVSDVGPFAERKLCLLNGGHSLLAYAGSALGHETVADAVADPRCRAWLEEWWGGAAPVLSLSDAETSGYCAALLGRWRNPRIGHALSLIARDGSQKLVQRVIPVVRRYLEAGGAVPPGVGRMVGAWLAHLRGSGAEIGDPRAEELVRLAQGALEPAARALLEVLLPGLGADHTLVDGVAASCRQLESMAGDPRRS
ncbi:MAG: mannitol dehydrogenase family protein [Candidatus Dormibacteria bacterium]